MRYCSKCGAEIGEDSIYCYSCGERVEGSDVQRLYAEDNDYSEVLGDIKERNIILAVIFSLITCGIYSIYWMIKINDDSLCITKESGPSGIVVFLLNLLTCGIYGYFWSFKMGCCVDKMKNNQVGSTGFMYVVLSFLGLNLVNYIISQDAINSKIR